MTKRCLIRSKFTVNFLSNRSNKMALYIRMQDQITNRIDEIMKDDHPLAWLDDTMQTTISLIILVVFLAFGVTW